MRTNARLTAVLLLGLIALLTASPAFAQETNETMLPMGLRIRFDSDGGPAEFSQSIRFVLLMTLLSLAPSAIIMMTSFTRILIVFGFLRHAMGTQSSPPSQVLTGMAIFLTLFVMSPVWNRINTDAVQPYMAEELTQKEAWEKGIAPLRQFMAGQTGEAELALFTEVSGSAGSIDELGLEVLIPAFMISELKTAFQMGFLIYLPFLVIDLVVSTVLMALGMMMLPPMMISLPVKLLFFVLADGWTVMVRSLVASFSM